MNKEHMFVCAYHAAQYSVQAWLDYEAKHNFFNASVNDEIKKQVETMLNKARLTFTEHELMLGLVESLTDMEGGKNKINEQVRTFASANLDVTELNATMWLLCQGVTAGKPIPQS